MGQQQLFLTVLGIVIVGIAIVTGLATFTRSNVESNSDALLQDALRISTDAQAWKQRPEIFDGSPDAKKGDAADYSSITFFSLGYGKDAVVDRDCYENQNGQFTLFPSDDGLGILATSVLYQNTVALEVRGQMEADVKLLDEDWNPVRGGAAPDGSSVTVRTHARCKGKSNAPIHSGVR